MFLNLPQAPIDPLWALTAAFEADPRPHKMDLGLGIYRDACGGTPVLDVVRDVERRLAAEARSKAYRPLSGNAEFNAGISRLLLGEASPALERAVAIQTVGGTGALRTLGELVAAVNPRATVWLSNPGYHNNPPLMMAAGLSVAEYPWRAVEGHADPEPILASLEKARHGDILLLQGCCHNPTGVDLTDKGWRSIADMCERRGLVPLVDMAYQGLGAGLDDDARGLRTLVGRIDTVLIAASCSKNMGLYCERTGAAIAVVSANSAVGPTRSVLEGIGRRTHSMPPEHGAAIAAALLAAPAAWHAELAAMRTRIHSVRTGLAQVLRQAGASDSLRTVGRHRGMFSTLPLDGVAMNRLRADYAIYGTPAGRINVAGIATDRIADVAHAIAAVASPH